MDLKKLKIGHLNRFLVRNFPKQYIPELKSVESNIEVILFYIDSVADVSKFVKLCETADLIEDNRVIMIYEKGRKDGVNRDSIFMPFKQGKYTGFKMKAPMLCSISDRLSAFVQQKEI
jgi:hypothetical protein